MPTPFPHLPPEQRGAVTVHRHASAALIGNAWGDPSERDVIIYTPSGSTGRDLPAILLLPAYAGTGEKLQARGLSDVPMSARLDRLIADGCPPFVAVMPDVMTTLGGCQYVDSAGIGRYATWLADEVPAFVDATVGTNGRWGVAGRSSGGFGAIHLALERPGAFRVVGCHSGDMGFDLCYLADLAPALRGFAAAGGLDRFVAAFWAKDEPSPADFAALNLLCMACAYGGDASQTPIPARLPIDATTGEVDFDVIRGWFRFDPVVRDVSALARLDGLWLDVGDRDEHGLHYGARRLVRRLVAAGIGHRYEEFPGGHRGNLRRWDLSLPWMAAILTQT